MDNDDSADSDPTQPVESDGSTTAGWTTYRGTTGGTGRAHTELSGPFQTERLWGWDEPLSTFTDHPRLARSTPGVVVSDSTVYATAVDPEFEPIAVGREESQLRWRFTDLVSPHEDEFQRTPTPVVADGDVFVHTASRRCRIDDGDPVWTEPEGLWVGDEFIGDASELYTSAAIGRVDPTDGTSRGAERAQENGTVAGLAVDTDVAVHALRTDDGTAGLLVGYDDAWSVEWELNLPSAPLSTAPTVTTEAAYAVAGGRTVAVDTADGDIDWESECSGCRIGPAIDDNTVYVPHIDHGLVAFDARDGEQTLTATIDSTLTELVGAVDHAFPPIVADDAVVLSGPAGIAILDRDDGTIRHRIDRPLVGAPAVAFGDVYAITTDEVFAIRGRYQ